MIKIDIDHFDIEFERNIQCTEAYIELHDTYFRYVAKYDSEVPTDRDDLKQGWHDKFSDFDIILKRENFVSVEKYWNDKCDYWQIEMEVNGFPAATVIYFKKGDEERMRKTFNKLFNWVFKKQSTLWQTLKNFLLPRPI